MVRLVISAQPVMNTLRNNCYPKNQIVDASYHEAFFFAELKFLTSI